MAAEERSDVPPATLPVNADGVPADLKKWDQWVTWDWEFRNDRWTKPPLRAVGNGYAKSNDPNTWTSFDIALAASLQRKRAGIGFALTKDDPFFFVDLDDARDPATGGIAPWARPLLRAFRHTYHEVSPTATGIKIIGTGTRPGTQSVKPLVASDRAKIEIFDGGGAKYTTLTGHRCQGSPGHIADAQAALTALYVELFPDEDQEAEAPGSRAEGGLDDDDDRLTRARSARNGAEFSRLFDSGDLSGHGGDHSSADLALCNHLAFWFGPDPMRVDRVFRRSALMRPKWDEKHYADGRSYGQGTVDTALAGRADFYQPQPRLHVFRGGKSTDDGDETGDTREKPPPAPTESPPHLTDMGNAKRLRIQHGQDVRFCKTWGFWLWWDGRRWRRDDTDAIVRLAKEMVGTIYAEAAAASDEDTRKALAKHALKSEAEARVRAAISLAETEPGIPIRPENLDRDRWLLNVQNGTLDLKTGHLCPHNHDDLITKLVPVDYDPDAPCPTFLAFLERIMESNTDLIRFLQRAAGYSLTGDTSERALLILHGEGRNGKSTLLETLRGILGDYALRTPTDTLLAKRDSGIPNDVARLKGMRLVTASEADEGRRFDEARIKDLTGGDTISARFMRGEFFDFLPEFTLWLGTNHKPVIRGTDRSIWDRIRLVPFAVRIPDDEQDKHLKDKLMAESTGILAWAVRGCLEWQRDGLSEPEAVKQATAGYRAEMDVLGDFIEDRCVVAEIALVSAKNLYSTYHQWCDESGERSMTQKAMGLRLAERGFDSARMGKTRIRTWLGIGLADDATGEN
jgi:putative DNA primase/helicase